MLTLMRNGGHAVLLRGPDNDGDGDGSMGDADARAARVMQDRLSKAAKDDDDDQDEDDFEVEVGPATHRDPDDGEPPPSRTERRRERGGLHSEVERLRGELERMRAAPPPVYQQPPPQPQLPSLDQIRETLDNEFERIQSEELELERTIAAHVAAKTMTQETFESLKAKQRQLRKDNAVVQRRFAELEDGSIMRRFQAHQPQVDPATAALNAEYSDVVQDQRAMQYASGYYAREAARIQMGERAAITPYALRREAWQAGRNLLEGKQQTNSARRPAPTRESRARYTGMSTNSQSGSGAPAGAKKVTITPQEDSMAQERFKHLKTPQERRVAFIKMKAANERKREQAG